MKQPLETQKVNFTQIANEVLNDDELSAKAKGLFSYMYSKPDDWDFHVDRIAEDMDDGRRAVMTGLQELEDAGYLIRKKQKSGRILYYLRWDKNHDPKDEKSDEKDREQAKVTKPQSGEDKPKSRNSKVRKPQSAKTANIKKKENKKTNNSKKSNAETSSADSEEQENWNKNDPMELQDFLRYCRASDQRHINIIGEYADEKNLDYETFGQWQQFLKRNLRPARRLSPFTDEQIADAMEKLDSDRAENDGYLTRWTLETVEKYLE